MATTSILTPPHSLPAGVRWRVPCLPYVALRMRVLVQRGMLDRALASGAEPMNSPMLTLRAGQLTCVRARATIADAVEGALRAAGRNGRRVLTSAVDPDPIAVRSNRTLLQDVVERLRSGEHVAPGGVARLLLLLRDGGGPLYAPGEPWQLTRALDGVDRALSP